MTLNHEGNYEDSYEVTLLFINNKGVLWFHFRFFEIEWWENMNDAFESQKRKKRGDGKANKNSSKEKKKEKRKSGMKRKF